MFTIQKKSFAFLGLKPMVVINRFFKRKGTDKVIFDEDIKSAILN